MHWYNSFLSVLLLLAKHLLQYILDMSILCEFSKSSSDKLFILWLFLHPNNFILYSFIFISIFSLHIGHITSFETKMFSLSKELLVSFINVNSEFISLSFSPIN